MATQRIDFVITWIKDNDLNWLNEKSKYLSENTAGDGCARQFRNRGLLRYWFRGVERFAPWVNKVHFVTYGHLTEWLNVDHPKI